jgi:hypothetical protein
MSDQTLNPQDNPNQGQQGSPLFSVGDRQYDAEAAQKKIINADNHINTIESENATLKQKMLEMQAQLDQATKLDDALAQLGQQQTPAPQPTETPTPVDVEALKADLLRQAQEAANNSVASFQQQQIAGANQNESISAAQKFYGSEYESKLREKGAELGLDDTAIVNMAKGNPVLFKRTFGLEGNPKVTPNVDGSVNTGGMNPSVKPDLKPMGKQWGSTAKLEALNHNEAQIAKVLADHGGDLASAARSLGIDIKNFAG